MLLEGKNAVVTGCLRGIGRKTMEVLAKEGANVWACCERLEEEFVQAAAALAQACGVWIKPICFDMADGESIKAGMKEILKDKQPVDALVNVAGITHNALFQMTSMDAFRSVFEINFFAQMQLTQTISKLMARKKSGSVIFISSISGLDGTRGQAAYSAAKGALLSATKTLALELAPQGVRVNAIAPGVIDTAMTQALSDVQRKELIANGALPRLGTAEEVANAIAFLASDLASYITGQILRVDGGIG